MNWIKGLNRNRWNLAFFENANLKDVFAEDYSSVHWMKYKDRTRWFADPFILTVKDDIIEVLVEELSYSKNKGRIAKLVVDRKSWQLRDMIIILELPTHLSFPMIFRRGTDVFVIPENSASGKSVAYLYNPEDEALIPQNTVCSEPLTDATIFEFSNRHYMFATSIPDPNGKELDIYSFDPNSLKAEKIKTISFNRPIARNAGTPFVYDGNLYRPAQDCEGAYGKGVVIQKINCNNDSIVLDFEDRDSIYPFSRKYQLGIHTLNMHDGMCVIDGRGLLYPTVGRIVRPIINKLKQ